MTEPHDDADTDRTVDPAHRVRRRRRAASRPAGPPNPGTDPTSPEATAARPEPQAPPADPVARADRRREKRRRSRTDSGGDPDRPDPTGRATGGRRGEDSGRGRSGTDRAARALEGNRATQVSPVDALRARDWAAPDAADLAQAEADLVIVRRHYRPSAPLAARQTSESPTPAERNPQRRRRS